MISQTYDLDAHALYITVSDHRIARTAEIDTDTLVDVDATGAVVGIEVLNFERCWPLTEILDRFHVGPEDAEQLRAYFSSPAQLILPQHPDSRVLVAI